jgi:dihydroorotate dehydrogenase electron transfer subunit
MARGREGVRRRLTVAGNDDLGRYRVLRLADPEGLAPQPGQFSMLAAVQRWGGGEDERPFVPRAFSVARLRDGEAHYLLEDVGPGTRRLWELTAGEEIWVLGPLGRGFSPPPAGRRAILVGGGVGIAPLAILQDALLLRPDAFSMVVLLGFRDGAHAVGGTLLTGAQIATDDGSVGHRGLVTELLARELDADPAAVVYACGPAPMLEAARALCAAREVPAQLALESGMACGFGACFGCVVPTRDGGYVRVCVDGPVLDATLLERVDAHAGAPA